MPTAEAPAIRASALADLTLSPRNGRTRLVRVETRPPLTIQRALYLDEQLPDQAWVFLANPAAGLLAGDDHQIRIRLEPGARAHVTTQAATKVFSMPGGSARQRVELAVADGAVLEYFPEPVIPFIKADFEQRLRLIVNESAVAFLGEILTPGRLAAGECFEYERLRSSITVERPGGATLYHEAFALEPQRRSPMRPGLLGTEGKTPLLTTFVAVGPRLDARDTLGSVRECLHPEAWSDVTALPAGGGLIVKALSADVPAARTVIRQAWTVVRRLTMGAEPPLDRRR